MAATGVVVEYVLLTPTFVYVDSHECLPLTGGGSFRPRPPPTSVLLCVTGVKWLPAQRLDT